MTFAVHFALGRPELTNSLLPEERDHWIHRVYKNLGALSVARGVTAALSLGLTAYLTRVLGPETYGIIGFATALFAYLLLFSRLGFDVVGTRELARDHTQIRALAGYIIGVRLLLALIGYALYAGIVVFVLSKGEFFTLIVLIFGLAVFAHAISLDWAYRGIERMGIIAVRIVATSAVHLALVILLVRAPHDAPLAICIQAASLFLLNIWLLASFVRTFGAPTFSGGKSKKSSLWKAALPMAGSGFMIGIFYNVDLIMLGLMRTDAEVGLYSASVRAMSASLILAMIAAHAFFPALSNAFGDTKLMRERSKAFARLILPVGIPLSISSAMLAEPLIVLFAGVEYSAAAPAFALLMVNAGLVYICTVLGRPLLAWNREKAYMTVVGTAAVLDIILNIVLIPRYGIIGGATATVCAQIVVLIGFGYVHVQLVGQLYLSVIVKTLVGSTCGVVLPVLLLKSQNLHVLILLILCGVTYSAVAILMNLFPVPALLKSMKGREG